MKILTVTELKKWMDQGRDFELIDVREPHEYQAANIEGSKLVPLSTVPQYLGQLPEDKPIVMQCRSGARSGVAQDLALRFNEDLEIYNLKGGILAWKEEIDPSLNAS